MQEEVWRWPHPSWTNSWGAGIVPGEALGAGPAPAQDATCKESPDQSTPTWETLGATGGQGPRAGLLWAHDGHSPLLKPCCQL